MGRFRHLSIHILRGLYFRKYISYEGRLFFQDVQHLIYISKTEPKIGEEVFVSGIIASELVPLNCPFNNRRFVIGIWYSIC